MSGVPTRIEGITIPDGALAIHARVRVSDGYLTLLSDGERLTGAHALGPKQASGFKGHPGHPRPRLIPWSISFATRGRGVRLITSPANADAAGRPAAHPEPLMPRSEVSQLR
jgi:hypothetical protein